MEHPPQFDPPPASVRGRRARSDAPYPESVVRGDRRPPPRQREELPVISDHELIRCVGQGAYGEVWLARNVLGTYRAVKVVFRDSFSSDRPYDREYRGIQRFEPVSRTNDGLMDILQVGRNDAQGCFYYVMELADDGLESRLQREGLESRLQAVSRGPLASTLKPAKAGTPSEGRLKAGLQTYTPKTLSSEIHRTGRLPADECVQLGLALTSALGHLHRHGLIHRDIKPSNIIFVQGVPKLADIGLVVEVEEALSFVGTEGFMPPEGPTSPQADLYSLGKVLYEVSMGKDRKEYPEPMTALRDMPDRAEQEMLLELNAVILKACAENVRERYQTAEDFHADLALVQSGKSVRRRRWLEQRVATLTRLSLVGVTLTALVTAGYFYQQHLTQTAKRLAVQLQVNNGVRLLDESYFQGALLWFAEALREGDSYLSADERAQHRLRINTVLQQCPKLAQLIVPEVGDGKVADYGGWAEFSPDGRQILISGYGRTVLICDAATGETIRRLDHRKNVRGATFSGNGRRVITWTESAEEGIADEVQIWDASSGQRVGQPLTHQLARSIAISHDGHRVFTFSRLLGQVWDADTGQKLSPPLRHESPVTGSSFSPDGRRVLTGSRSLDGRAEGSAQIWDAATGERIGPPMKRDGDVRALFNSDAARVLTHSRGQIDLWDGLTAHHLLTIPWPHGGNCFFTLDGKRIILTAWASGEIETYDPATGERIGPTIRQAGGCAEAAVSPDGRQIAGFGAGRLHVWDVSSGQPVVPAIPQNDHCHFSFSPDGRLLLTAGGENDPVIRVWDLSSAEPATPPLQHAGWVFRAAFSPDGRRIVTASADETARVWDVGSGQSIGLPLHTNHTADYSMFATYDLPRERLTHPLTGELVRSFPSGLAQTNVFHPVLGDKITGPEHRLRSTDRSVFFAASAPDSKRVVTTSYDGTARVWEAETGRELIPALKHQGAIFHAAFSRDNHRIVIASADWTAHVWDVATGQPVGPPLQHQGAVLHADFSPNGRAVVTASYDMTAQVWEAETGVKLSPPLKHPNADNGPVFTAKFSPEGQRIVTASYDGTAQVWDVRTGNKTTPPLRHRNFVFHAEFSPDGKQVLTASRDQTAQLWDAVTGAKVAPPLQHTGEVNHATFSADGKRIVTASFDGTARVWDAATSQSLTPPLRHHDKVWHAEFSPDGQRVLTASSDGTARLWPLAQIDWPVADLRSLAQTLAGRQIDHTGSLSPLAPEVLKENWRKLPSRHPDYFRGAARSW